MTNQKKSIPLDIIGPENKKSFAGKEQGRGNNVSVSACFRAAAHILHRPMLLLLGLLPIVASLLVDTDTVSNKVFDSSSELLPGFLRSGLFLTGASNLTAMAMMWSDGHKKTADTLGVATAVSATSILLAPINPYVWSALATTVSAGVLCQFYSICASAPVQQTSAPSNDVEMPAPGESNYVRLDHHEPRM